MSDTPQKSELADKDVLEELHYASSRISELARYVGFGLAALFYVFASSTSEFAKSVMQQHGDWILFLSAVGCAVIALDYIQFIAAYRDNQTVLQRMQEGGLRRYTLTWPYKVRKCCFFWKQFFSILGTVLFIGLLLQMHLSGALITAQKCKEGESIRSLAVSVHLPRCYDGLSACSRSCERLR